MARKISPLEQQLDRLAELRREAPSPEGRAEVAKCVGSKSNLVAAKAARIAREWEATELGPDAVAAFDRFLVKPETTDRRCEAKIEILKALCRLDYPSPGVFRRGMQHVQMEASFGPPVDTAAEVRALSAMGLAQTDYPEALEEIGAIRAVAASGLAGDVLLLRLKALSGDEPEVLGEGLAALLRAAPDKSLEFVAQFRAKGARSPHACLRLGRVQLPIFLPSNGLIARDMSNGNADVFRCFGGLFQCVHRCFCCSNMARSSSSILASKSSTSTPFSAMAITLRAALPFMA